MQKLAEICIRRPVFATMLILALVVVGSAAYFKLGVDRGDGWVELSEGVTQGKQVATSGLSKLADGTQVVIRTDVAPGA